jgi:drug/metabolite transporter (DMT)-like permease
VVLAKKLLRNGVTSWTMVASTFLVGFVSTLPFLYLNGGILGTLNEIKNISFNAHLGVIFMALASGLLAYDLSNKAQKTIEIGDAAVFQFLYPIIAIPLAVFWLKETLTIPYVIGAVIVSLGVAIATFKRRPKK